jgi:hypothetical protein
MLSKILYSKLTTDSVYPQSDMEYIRSWCAANLILTNQSQWM